MLRVLQSPYIRALKFIHKIPIVNNMKGRVTLIALLLTLTSAVSASAASGAVRLSAHSYCGSRCGQVAAIHGAGTLQQWGTGVTYGTVGQGTIAIQRPQQQRPPRLQRRRLGAQVDEGRLRLLLRQGHVLPGLDHVDGQDHRRLGRVDHDHARSASGYIKGAAKNNAWLDTHWTLGSGRSPSQWPHWPTAGKSFAIGH